MKILAINSSPHGKQGHTDFILQNLLLGMQQAGHSVETIYLNKLTIKPCMGCVACWFKTPGECIHHDDMQFILPKMLEADVVIYATPLYVFSMSGMMKSFLDRLLPLASPFFVENKNDANSTMHPRRYETNKIRKMFLVSSAAFPEMKHFEPLVHTFKHIAKATGNQYLGEILKPASKLLKDEKMKNKTDDYARDLQTAGKQLVEHEMINTDLLLKLHEPWTSATEYCGDVNSAFRKKLNHEPLNEK